MKKFFCFLALTLLWAQGFSDSYETTIQSDEAYYNGDTITLVNNVQVENIMGKVTAQKAVLKKDEKKTTRIDFPWVELSKNVMLSLPKGDILKCETVTIDYIQMTSLLKGSPYVIYTTENNEIMAEEAHIEYVEAEGTIKPKKVVLQKSVRLSNRGTVDNVEEQYALADIVTYFPDQECMILEGRGNKVLFYDKKRDMQLSARSVHATRNPETKKESVQGIGDVRFVFGPDELQKIKTRFHLEEN